MEIVFNRVTHVYNEKTPLSKEAVIDLNFTIKKGVISGVAGNGGCGKTTVLELINALEIPTIGQVNVGDKISSKKHKMKDMNSFRHKIGLVFQNPEEQFFCNTVRDEIEFGMKAFSKSINEKHIIDALMMVELDESYLELNPVSLSSGEKRKLALASILAFNPKILMLDEPTVGLDNRSKNNLIKIIKLLKTRYKKTIIIVSKDTDFLHKITDYIYVLKDGKIVLEGNKYDVFTNEKLEETGIKRPSIIEFEMMVKQKKNVKLLYRDDINDLMKDVYRSVK